MTFWNRHGAVRRALRLLLALLILSLLTVAGGQAQEPLPLPPGPDDGTAAPVTGAAASIAVRLAPGTNPDALAASYGLVNRGQIGTLDGYYLFEQPSGPALTAQAPGQQAAVLGAAPGVLFAEVQVPLVRVLRAVEDTLTDPLFPQQWHLNNIGQSGGTPGIDLNVFPAWNLGYTGEGVNIAVVDNGMWPTHPDIAPNYTGIGSYDFIDDDPNPAPSYNAALHGNAVSGLVAAAPNNDCGVGVAFDSNLSGIRLVGGGQTDAREAQALSYRYDLNQIYNNSWGPSDTGDILGDIGPLAEAAILNGINEGRGGLGAIYVWAGGNGRALGDHANADAYVASIYTIGVGAVSDQGGLTDYSEPGPALLVSAPSATDLFSFDGGVVTSGYGASDCASRFGGTSSAAPMVAGVVALMLEANPALSWRDVQYILINTAVQNDPSQPEWSQNAIGRWFNPNYGFGLVDAGAAVELALDWKPVGSQITLPQPAKTPNQVIPADGTPLLKRFTVAQDIRLEHVELALSATHDYRGQIEVTLTSPSGTTSRLIYGRSRDYGRRFDNWKLMSTQFWGESSAGTWTVSVSDTVSDGWTGTLESLQLILHGSDEQEPSDLTVTAVTETSTALSWTDNAVNETGFILEYSIDSGSTWQDFAVLPAGETNFTAAPLQTCSTYYWRVRAVLITGPTSPSNNAAARTTGCNPAQLIENGTFEGSGPFGRLPDIWTPLRLLPKDILRCNTRTRAIAIEGQCAFRFGFDGLTNFSRVLLQRITPQKRVEAGDTLQLAFHADARELSENFRVVVRVIYEDGTRENLRIDLPPGTYDYQSFESSLKTSGPVQSIVVRLIARPGTQGRLLVDDFSLTHLYTATLLSGAATSADVIPLPVPAPAAD